MTAQPACMERKSAIKLQRQEPSREQLYGWLQMADKQSDFMEALQLRMSNAREQRQMFTTPEKGTSAAEQDTKSPALLLLSPGLAALRGLTPTRNRSQSPVSTTRSATKRRRPQVEMEATEPKTHTSTTYANQFNPDQTQAVAETTANTNPALEPASSPLSLTQFVNGQPFSPCRRNILHHAQLRTNININSLTSTTAADQQSPGTDSKQLQHPTTVPYNDYSYQDHSPTTSSIIVPSSSPGGRGEVHDVRMQQDLEEPQGGAEPQHFQLEDNQAVQKTGNRAKRRNGRSKIASQSKAVGGKRRGRLKSSAGGTDGTATGDALDNSPVSRSMVTASESCVNSQRVGDSNINEQKTVVDSKQPSRRKVNRVPQPKVVYPPGVWVAEGEDPRHVSWIPPASPFSLLEEVLYDNPWALLLACILLNKTSGRQVRKMLGSLLSAFPTPQAMAAAGDEAGQAQLIHILRPLGLFRKRAASLVRFSKEYLELQWTDPRQLHAVGAYGADAYALFCRGAWSLMPRPADKDLARYYDWIHATGGQGEGLQRESLEHVLQQVGMSVDVNGD